MSILPLLAVVPLVIGCWFYVEAFRNPEKAVPAIVSFAIAIGAVLLPELGL